MNTLSSYLLFIIALSLSLIACNDSNTQILPEHHRWNDSRLTILKQLWIAQPVPAASQSNRFIHNPSAIALGKTIFFDQRFSSNQQVACATCHQPDKYFTDGLQTAVGIAETQRNTPTIVGASQHSWFFHDGRADSLWSQALGPLENAAEHGGNRSFYAQLIFNNIPLREKYEKVFGTMPNISNPIRFPENAAPLINNISAKNWQLMTAADQQIINKIFVNIGKSLAAWQTTQQPEISRFDRYVEALVHNDKQNLENYLNKKEAAGLRLFIGRAKCVLCHNGPMFSDQSFHNIGSVTSNSSTGKFDSGRYDGVRSIIDSEFNCHSQFNDNTTDSCDELKYINTEQHETLASFKTPGLRNISRTAPYFHDGQYRTLAEVIQHYAAPLKPVIGNRDLLLPITLNKQEIRQLEAFLITLNNDVSLSTGKVSGYFTQAVTLSD